jgi:hypothetical protein
MRSSTAACSGSKMPSRPCTGTSEAPETHTYDFVLAAARQRGNRRAIRQLEAIGPPPHLGVKEFTTRARLAANFGGVASGTTFTSMFRDLLVSLVRSPDYPVTDVIRAVRGITASTAAQGGLDQVAPAATAQRFHDSLIAPSKQLVWFEKSAYTPHRQAGSI